MTYEWVWLDSDDLIKKVTHYSINDKYLHKKCFMLLWIIDHFTEPHYLRLKFD